MLRAVANGTGRVRRQVRGAGASGQTSDPSVASINAEGWSVAYTSPPASFDPVGSPKYVWLSRAGYNTSGGTTTYTQSCRITTRTRQTYPNNASLDSSKCALEDYIYSTDTILGGQTNNSTEISPKAIVVWAMPDRRPCGNSLLVEAVCFHRNFRNGEPVACMVATATDQHGHSNTQTVSTTTILTGTGGDALPAPGFSVTFDTSGFTDGDKITVDAQVYPWLGAAASVATTVGTTESARGFSTQVFMKKTAPFVAYVNATTGNDTTGVASQTPAVARLAPCLTIGGAINKLYTAAGSNVDACEVRLMAGTHSSFGTISAARTQTTGIFLTIRRDEDASSTKANTIITWGSAFRFRLNAGTGTGYVRFTDLTMNRTVVGAGFTIEASSFLWLWMDNLTFDNGSQSAVYFPNTAGNVQFMTGCTVTNYAGNQISAANTEVRIVRGNNISAAAAVGIEGNVALGNVVSNGGSLSTGSRSASNTVVAYNRFGKLTVEAWNIGATADVTGAALVQNIIEEIGTDSSIPSMGISRDTPATGNTTHIIVWNNTVLGANTLGRSNSFYDNTIGTTRTHKLMSVVGNIFVSVFTKCDVFVAGGGGSPADAPNHPPGPFYYGLGCYGNFTQFMAHGLTGLNVDPETQGYPGIAANYGTSNSVRNDPLFTSYAGSTYNGVSYSAGAGGGVYTLPSNSPCKAMVPVNPLKYDLAGTARPTNANQTAGCYEAA